jgi:hypothetical protein
MLTQTRLAMSTSHHPKTERQTGEANRTLKEIIRHYIKYQQNNWDDMLPALEHDCNSKFHATTGLAPFTKTLFRFPESWRTSLLSQVLLPLSAYQSFSKDAGIGDKFGDLHLPGE